MSNQVWSNSTTLYDRQYIGLDTISVAGLFSPAVNSQIRWSGNPQQVTIYFSGINSTSSANVNFATWTLPSSLPKPLTSQIIPMVITSNSANSLGLCSIASNGNCSFGNLSGWTSGNTCGIGPQAITYYLN